jgi:hypothetical protein
MGKSFLHDSGARHDPKLIRLVMEKGEAAGFRWWCLVEFMREHEGSLSSEEIVIFAYDRRLEFLEAKHFVDYCVSIGLLYTDGEYYQSESLNRRIAAYNSRAKAGSENVGKRKDRLVTTKDDCLVTGRQSGASELSTTANIIQYNIIDNNDLNISNDLIKASGAVEMAPGVIVDEIAKEQATAILIQNGLEASDLQEAARCVALNYKTTPGRPRNPSMDLTASWVIQSLLKTKTEKIKASTAKQRAAPIGRKPTTMELNKDKILAAMKEAGQL